jgi:simple sugar transport system permease protein
VVLWTFTVTIYTLGVPANALLAAKAVLVMLVIFLYSDYSRRLMNRIFERKGSQHGAAN